MGMREILFRGKRCDNLEWIEGYLLKECNLPTCSWNLGIEYKTDRFGLFAYEVSEVVPYTVGQFTGLTDENGKKIFEGDIVRVLGNQQVEDWKCVDYIGSVAFLDAGFCVIDGTIEDHGFRRYGLPRLDFTLEVIGNIHDNPELLKGSSSYGERKDNA